MDFEFEKNIPHLFEYEEDYYIFEYGYVWKDGAFMTHSELLNDDDINYNTNITLLIA